MSSDNLSTTSLVIDFLDPKIQDNLMNLDQKARGVRAEVEAKLNNIALYKGDDKAEYQAALTTLFHEMETLINSVHNWVDSVREADDEDKANLSQSETVLRFGERVANCLEMVNEIKAQL